MEGKSKNIAILLCGGSGERFGGELPKQYVPFGGHPLCFYPLKRLSESELIDQICIVAKQDTFPLMEDLIQSNGIAKVNCLVAGGKTRQESVYKALLHLKENGASDEDIVLIQDGDRPNLTHVLIKEGIELARIGGASVTALHATDSLFRSFDGEKVDSYIPRETCYRVQTPQTFRFCLILEAHEKGKAAGKSFTDDASMVLGEGKEVYIVSGSEDNYKINTVEDGMRFERDLERREK